MRTTFLFFPYLLFPSSNPAPSTTPNIFLQRMVAEGVFVILNINWEFHVVTMPLLGEFTSHMGGAES